MTVIPIFCKGYPPDTNVKVHPSDSVMLMVLHNLVKIPLITGDIECRTQLTANNSISNKIYKTLYNHLTL